MPEKFLYARCRVTDCGKIFEGNLTWDGTPGDADVYDQDGKSPLVDLLQQHHLETGLLSKHNNFVIFITKEHAMIPPNQNAGPYMVYRESPFAVASLGVTRQRNIAFSLRLDPTTDKFKKF